MKKFKEKDFKSTVNRVVVSGLVLGLTLGAGAPVLAQASASGSALEGITLESRLEAETVHYKDGIYQGKSFGISAPVYLEVTIEGGKITAIREISQNETPKFWEKALAMFDRIIEQQTTDVDVVTGATLSSDTILDAVDDALRQAKMSEDEVFVLYFSEQVATLPAPELVTLKDAVAVQAVRAYYEGLSELQKAMVSKDDLNRLVALEQAIADLKAQAEEVQPQETPDSQKPPAEKKPVVEEAVTAVPIKVEGSQKNVKTGILGSDRALVEATTVSGLALGLLAWLKKRTLSR